MSLVSFSVRVEKKGALCGTVRKSNCRKQRYPRHGARKSLLRWELLIWERVEKVDSFLRSRSPGIKK